MSGISFNTSMPTFIASNAYTTPEATSEVPQVIQTLDDSSISQESNKKQNTREKAENVRGALMNLMDQGEAAVIMAQTGERVANQMNNSSISFMESRSVEILSRKIENPLSTEAIDNAIAQKEPSLGVQTKLFAVKAIATPFRLIGEGINAICNSTKELDVKVQENLIRDGVDPKEALEYVENVKIVGAFAATLGVGYGVSRGLKTMKNAKTAQTTATPAATTANTSSSSSATQVSTPSSQPQPAALSDSSAALATKMEQIREVLSKEVKAPPPAYVPGSTTYYDLCSGNYWRNFNAKFTPYKEAEATSKVKVPPSVHSNNNANASGSSPVAAVAEAINKTSKPTLGQLLKSRHPIAKGNAGVLAASLEVPLTAEVESMGVGAFFRKGEMLPFTSKFFNETFDSMKKAIHKEVDFAKTVGADRVEIVVSYLDTPESLSILARVQSLAIRQFDAAVVDYAARDTSVSVLKGTKMANRKIIIPIKESNVPAALIFENKTIH